MSVAYFFEIPQLDDGTAQQINAYINERLGNRQPDGGIYHAEGPDGSGGRWSFNVWESEEHFTRFYDEFVRPAVEKVGVTPASPRRLDVSWDTSQISGRPSD